MESLLTLLSFTSGVRFGPNQSQAEPPSHDMINVMQPIQFEILLTNQCPSK